MATQRPLLISADADIIDDTVRLAAANGVELHLATDIAGARPRWPLAALALVGADLADEVAAARLSRRRGVVIVTRQPDEQLWPIAVELGAERVAQLPADERWLIDRLADSAEGPPRDGRIVAVMGTGAGAGASTLAAALALAAAAQRLRVLLVDADPLGGGIDLLLGLEDSPGIRWPDLVETRGRLASTSLDEALPHVEGVAVLSWGRAGPLHATPEAMAALLSAGSRGYDLVVVDLARNLDAVAEVAVAHATQTLLVATNRVRGAAAAARIAALLDGRCPSVGLVLRSDPRGLLDDSVSASLGVPTVGRLPTVRSLAARADDGEPPTVRGEYGRACRALLASIAATVAA